MPLSSHKGELLARGPKSPSLQVPSCRQTVRTFLSACEHTLKRCALDLRRFRHCTQRASVAYQFVMVPLFASVLAAEAADSFEVPIAPRLMLYLRKRASSAKTFRRRRSLGLASAIGMTQLRNHGEIGTEAGCDDQLVRHGSASSRHKSAGGYRSRSFSRTRHLRFPFRAGALVG